MIITARDLIMTCRYQRGLTQRSLAQKVGVNEYTIWAWESGRHEPLFENVIDTLDAMGFELVLQKKTEKWK